ncbi:Oidioi.mRNA.OKI2018_I69.chr1.g1464.t1.cds [Oikopleura dioica]|uniref:Oidioi.mRNA.OKI2018_I69.chr1.g1464.t1.cds n=1 Tax=Oikopleura dioica TaxID=34765 RepID=A0ABN7SS89_OIKDI|nr:Oidioi.mRNA.OKI2018_I69.chr1.g1464.t1.cds [Oikopleura dioica]
MERFLQAETPEIPRLDIRKSGKELKNKIRRSIDAVQRNLQRPQALDYDPNTAEGQQNNVEENEPGPMQGGEMDPGIGEEPIEFGEGLDALNGLPGNAINDQEAHEVDSLVNELGANLREEEREAIHKEALRLCALRQDHASQLYDDLLQQRVKVHIRTKGGRGFSLNGEGVDF